MRTPLRAARRTTLAALLALASVTCTDQPTEPGQGHSARVLFAPSFAGTFAAGLPLDNVTVTVVRPEAETLAVVNVPFVLDDSTLQLDVAVDLLAESESLEVTLDLRSGVSTLFHGTELILVTSGPAGATPSIPLAYVGPGANIASIFLTPRDSALSFGDTLTFSATAADSFEANVGTFYLRWSSGTPGIAIRADGRIIAPNLRATVWIHAVTPTGVADSTQLTFTPVPTQLTKSGGDLQNGAVEDTLPVPLTVLVRAADNLPVKGVAVTFAMVSGGGSIVDSVVVTDSLGHASTTAVLGTTSGANSFSATVAGVGSVTFGATGGAGAPAAIAKQGGDAQSDTAGQALAPFVARVTDAVGNPVAGVAVVWTRLAGTGTLSADTVLTNASGDAAATYTLGSPGVDSVQAQIAGTGASVVFTATAVAGGFSIVEISGNGQVDTVGRTLPAPMVAEVHLQGTSTPAPGVMVQFSILYGGGSISVDSALSDSLGRVQVTYTLDTLTGYAEVMAATPTAGQYVTFQIEKRAAAPHHLTYAVAPADTLVSGALVTPAPVIQVRDTFGNVAPVAGLVIHAYTDGMIAAGPPVRATAPTLQFAAFLAGIDSAVTDSTGKATFDTLVVNGEVGAETLYFEEFDLGLGIISTGIYVAAGAPSSVIALLGEGQTLFVDSFAPIKPRVIVTDAGEHPSLG